MCTQITHRFFLFFFVMVPVVFSYASLLSLSFVGCVLDVFIVRGKLAKITTQRRNPHYYPKTIISVYDSNIFFV